MAGLEIPLTQIHLAYSRSKALLASFMLLLLIHSFSGSSEQRQRRKDDKF